MCLAGAPLSIAVPPSVVGRYVVGHTRPSIGAIVVAGGALCPVCVSCLSPFVCVFYIIAHYSRVCGGASGTKTERPARSQALTKGRVGARVAPMSRCHFTTPPHEILGAAQSVVIA